MCYLFITKLERSFTIDKIIFLLFENQKIFSLIQETYILEEDRCLTLQAIGGKTEIKICMVLEFNFFSMFL